MSMMHISRELKIELDTLVERFQNTLNNI